MATTIENGHAAIENGMGKAPAAAPAVGWRFARGSKEQGAMAATGDKLSIRAVRFKIMASVEERGPRPVLPLAHGDPSVFPAFRTAAEAEDAVAAALRTGEFNCYPAGVGLPAARRALAEHLSRDLPYELSSDDIFLTAGGTQAIEVLISVLSQPGANILLPKPGYPNYEARAAFNNLEVRRFDLIPEKGWEVDVDSLESLADENTTAMVLINPNNPCGSVYTYEHLAKVAEVARKLGILVIADEVYGNLVFGSSPFIPMGVFGHIAPVLTIGSLSKRWIVPGWRLGWVAVCDPKKILQESKIITSITNFLNVSTDPATFIQAALPNILEKTSDDFFKRIHGLLKETSEICFSEIKDNIKCLTCPHKPEGSMFVMVKLNLYLLEGIHDDIDFCCQLAKEESVILCPEFMLEENTKALNSKASILEEDNKLIGRDIQLLMNGQESKKNTQSVSYTTDNIKDMEDEVQQLQQEVSKINSNAYTIESIARDAEKRVEALSSEVKKIEDIISEQWIQIRQFEQAFVLTKMMTSKVHERSKPSKTVYKWPGKDTILKYVSNVDLNGIFLRGASYARSCFSHAYKQSRSFIQATNRYYHEVTRFGKAIRRQSIPDADRPDVFFLGGSASKRSCVSLPYKQFKSSMSSTQKIHRKVQVFIKKSMIANKYSNDLANEPVTFFMAYLVLISPMWIAWFLYSTRFGSRK